MQKSLYYPLLRENQDIELFPLNDLPDTEPGNFRKREKVLQEINNYLKSPEEIEAEFHSIAEAEERTINSFEAANIRNAEKEELIFTVDSISLILPDFMEENY
ncbi:MAG: hypothetical protein JWM28_1183 [Chitinophagaceae bacterium]|nr:hypothetical protein [Chitinophagaceae bacterium]